MEKKVQHKGERDEKSANDYEGSKPSAVRVPLKQSRSVSSNFKKIILLLASIVAVPLVGMLIGNKFSSKTFHNIPDLDKLSTNSSQDSVEFTQNRNNLKKNMNYSKHVPVKTTKDGNRIIQRASTDRLDSKHLIIIGVSVGAQEIARRHIVREYQMVKFKDYDITWRFMTGRVPPLYRDLYDAENSTFGDLIELDIPDSRKAARDYKPFAFFKYVEKFMTPHKYVSKMDTDAFLNVPLFWKLFFNETVQNMNNTIVSRLDSMKDYCADCYYPGGPFYSLSWDVMLELNRIYETGIRHSDTEDWEIGAMLCSRVNYNRVHMATQYSSDVDFFELRKDQESHTLNSDSVVMHGLKEEVKYLLVADSFDSSGLNEATIEVWRRKEWNPNQPDFESKSVSLLLNDFELQSVSALLKILQWMQSFFG